jgi:hypothetical protein
MKEEIERRLHASDLGPCVCAQARRLARKLSSHYDSALAPEGLTLYKAQRQFLTSLGPETMHQLRSILQSAETAATKTLQPDGDAQLQ